MRVCAAWPGYEHEGTLDWLRQRAGLSPSGWGLIRSMIEEYTLGLSGAAEHRMEALKQQVAALRKAL